MVGDIMYRQMNHDCGNIVEFVLMNPPYGKPDLFHLTEENIQRVKNKMAENRRLYEFHRFGSDSYCEAELLEERFKRQC